MVTAQMPPGKDADTCHPFCSTEQSTLNVFSVDLPRRDEWWLDNGPLGGAGVVGAVPGWRRRQLTRYQHWRGVYCDRSRDVCDVFLILYGGGEEERSWYELADNNVLRETDRTERPKPSGSLPNGADNYNWCH